MKVLHVPFTYYPDACGGTETYVEALAADLRKRSVESVIAAPASSNQTTTHDGAKVRRFAVDRVVKDLDAFYGDGDESAAREFAHLLDEEKPDVVHLHAWTYGISIRLVREAKRRGLPVVFTYHTPTASCPRGSLLRWGSRVCDGLMRPNLCAACTLHGLGMPRVAAWSASLLPAPLRKLAGAKSGGFWTAFRMRGLIEKKQAAFRALLSEADRIVAVSQWAIDLLRLNGVPADKIILSRHGIRSTARPVAPDRPDGFLKLAYFGRLSPEKGVHMLLEAMAVMRDAPLRLDIYGVVSDASGEKYKRRLERLIGDGSNVRFLEPVPHGLVTAELLNYDALVVPSLCLESGPLVVLEAFSAGVPVIGSDVGGVREMVRDGVDGLLVRKASAGEWAAVLRQLSKEPLLLKKLKSGVRRPRESSEAAAEMAALYAALAPKAAAHA